MNVALIHDWLESYAGSEKVLEQILNIYPDSSIYSLVDFLEEKQRFFIKNKSVESSFIQRLPRSKKFFRNYFPMFPLAIEQFDLGKFDLIISSSHCAAKGVITGPDQLHICYCHSPVRYAWDLQSLYLAESGLNKGIRSWFVRYLLFNFRNWDYRSASGVDYFIANSKYIARRIKKIYGRDSVVIYPNVAVEAFDLKEEKDSFYLTASRLVPYKKVDLIVQAFANMPDKKLVVIGDGPQINKLKTSASNNIEILGYQSFDVLREYMANCQAFIYAAEEDFGIAPVEAQACGTPVIAYGKGGVTETIISNKTGLFFYEQSASEICRAVKSFEKNRDLYIPKEIRRLSERFSTTRFCLEFESFVEEKWGEFNVERA